MCIRDSHTSTHGAFGAIAFGIGTSEVEHVLATQTLSQVRPKTMSVTVEGDLPPGATAKDVALAIIGTIGTGGGIGHIIEYRGSAIRNLSMEGRMTLCNICLLYTSLEREGAAGEHDRVTEVRRGDLEAERPQEIRRVLRHRPLRHAQVARTPHDEAAVEPRLGRHPVEGGLPVDLLVADRDERCV